MFIPNLTPKIGQPPQTVFTSSGSCHLAIFRYLDQFIIKRVIDQNEYRLPDILDPNDIIIDIGAHIGSFTYMCMNKGSKKIYSYEAFKDNYFMAESNLSNGIEAGIVKLYNLAVWRSDIHQNILYYVPDLTNSGGGHVFGTEKDIHVNTVRLDKIIDDVAKLGRIKLMKLDCEGSEFPILLTSKKLSSIDYICGEYHPTVLKVSDNINGKTHFNGNDIVSYLNGQGFSTIIIDPPDSIGIFFAKKKGSYNFFKNTTIPDI